MERPAVKKGTGQVRDSAEFHIVNTRVDMWCNYYQFHEHAQVSLPKLQKQWWRKFELVTGQQLLTVLVGAQNSAQQDHHHVGRAPIASLSICICQVGSSWFSPGVRTICSGTNTCSAMLIISSVSMRDSRMYLGAICQQVPVECKKY